MSIDEIWSDNPPVFVEAPAEEVTEASGTEEAGEETITFDDPVEPEKAFPGEPTTDTDAPFSKDTPSVSASAGTAEGADFEMVADVDDTGDAQDESGEELNLDDADYELDELEAEIARELED